MIRNIFLLLLVLTFTQAVYAQSEFPDYIREVSEAINPSRGVNVTFQAVQVEGTPLLFDDYVTAVLRKGAVESVPVRMNVDLMNNRIVVNEGTRVIGVDYDKVSSVEIIAPQKMILKNGFETGGKDDLNKNSLFVVIHEGEKYTVLRSHGVVLQEDVSTYGTATQKDVYVDYSDLYIITSDGSFEGLSSRKRRFFRVFGDSRSAVETFAGQNDLNIRNDDDLAKIFSFAESN